MGLKNPDFFALLQYILGTPLKQILADWSSLNEAEKPAVVEHLEELRHFSQRTLYQTVTGLLNEPSLSPIRAALVGWSIKDKRNIQEVREKLQQERLHLREGVRFSEAKPLLVNAFDVLIKIYCLVTFEDTALYLQTKKIVLPVKQRLQSEHIAALELVHANLTSLLSWERVSRLLLTERYAATDQTALEEAVDNFYPSPDIIISVVENTMEVINELHIFGQALLKSLREEDNMTDFYLNVDALLLAIKSVAGGHSDDEHIRQKLAFTRMVHDFIVDSATWSIMVSGLTSSSSLTSRRV